MTRYSEKIRKARHDYMDSRTRRYNSIQYLIEDVPELHKWQAEDYMKLISVDFEKNFKDIIEKYRDLEVFSDSIIEVYRNIWNNGLEGVTADMPEEQRRAIYAKKLNVWFWFKGFKYVKNNIMNNDYSHESVDEDDKKKYDSPTKQLAMVDEKDTRHDWNEAFMEAVFEYFSHHKTKVAMAGTGKFDTYKRQKLGIFAYSVFDMKHHKGMTLKQIGEKWKCSPRKAHFWYMKVIEGLRQNMPEILELTDRIYEKKFGIS